MPTWFIAVASVILAAFPVFIWLDIIHKEGEERGLYIKTFLTGTLAVIPPFLLILLFDRFPQLNIYSAITRTVSEAALAALLTNVVVGVIEEIAKNVIVRVIDKRHPEYIQTISSALKLSICAGLGFSFAENIFYFYNVWTSPFYGARDLFSTFIFRSIFTMCGHMVFSGIFGYFFGIGKFAADITEFSLFQGKTLLLAKALSRITGKLTFEVVRELKNLTGLFMAMAMHASFNASLDLEHKLPSLTIVVLGAAYIWYLLHTKSGHMMFSFVKRRRSTMAAKDQEVVMELLGMWTKEGKISEVLQICDRLLLRDPDNNVVKLFKAKARDDERFKKVYAALKGVFGKTGESASERGSTAAEFGKSLGMENEKVVLEVMDMWFKEGKYDKVLEVANRLVARNPNSEGARVLLDKAMDKEKLRKLFESLGKLFTE